MSLTTAQVQNAVLTRLDDERGMWEAQFEEFVKKNHGVLLRSTTCK